MRQTLLMLAIAVGSPLAMAQDPVSAATSSVIAAEATRQPAAGAAAPRTDSPQDHVKPAHKPVSAIGRALAELLQSANPQPALAKPHDTDIKPAAPRDEDAVRPTKLVAQDEPAGDS